jgi:hypothetical protein
MSEKRTVAIDAEVLAGRSFPYQHDMALVEDLDLLEATPGKDLNWLEDIELLEEDNTPAVFDRYSNFFLKIYFDIPEGREDEIARKVLMTHLISGNSYGIQLKEAHCKFHQGLQVGRRQLATTGPRGLGPTRPLSTSFSHGPGARVMIRPAGPAKDSTA